MSSNKNGYATNIIKVPVVMSNKTLPDRVYYLTKLNHNFIEQIEALYPRELLLTQSKNTVPRLVSNSFLT